MGFIIRNEQPGDWPKIVEVMNAAFEASSDRWASDYPVLYGALKDDSCPHLVAEENGKILGSLGIYPDVVRIGSARLRNGGIGAVSTIPEARGRGVMSALLRATNRQMLLDGVEVSLLGGARLRYARYGWEPVGYVRHLSISAKNLRQGGVKPLPVRRCRGNDLKAVQAVYESVAWGSERPVREFLGRIERGGTHVFCCGQDQSFVYAAVHTRGDSASVHELLGEADCAAGFLLGLTKRLRVDPVSVRLPDFAHPMREALFPFATGHHQTPVRQLQIANLPSLLAKVRGSLQTKAAQAKWRGSICLGLPERNQYVTLRRDTRGNFEVEAGRTSPCLELDWREAARLVFGGLPGEFDHLSSGPFDLLPEIFPLEWFFYPADCV